MKFGSVKSINKFKQIHFRINQQNQSTVDDVHDPGY